MSYIPQLLASLERRLDELTTEIAALEGARAALDGKTPGAPSPAVIRTGAGKSGQRRPSTVTGMAPALQPTRAAATDGRAGPAPTTGDAANPAARRLRPRAADRAACRGARAASRRVGPAARPGAGLVGSVKRERAARPRRIGTRGSRRASPQSPKLCSMLRERRKRASGWVRRGWGSHPWQSSRPAADGSDDCCWAKACVRPAGPGRTRSWQCTSATVPGGAIQREQRIVIVADVPAVIALRLKEQRGAPEGGRCCSFMDAAVR
jgi:hypothetical protein